jgi:hypothetical protein
LIAFPALQTRYLHFRLLFPVYTYFILVWEVKGVPMADKRKVGRRDFTYYMQVTDDLTKEVLGYLSDISTGGFKLDSQKQIRPGQDFRVRIELTPEIADKNVMVFVARSKWCHPDHIDPNSYNVGFEIVNMASGDMAIYQRMFDKYGTENSFKKRSSDDYLWK